MSGEPTGSSGGWLRPVLRTLRDCMRHLPVLRQFIQRAPELKSPREIGLMREAGKIVAEALRLCRAMAKPGAKTIEIDQAVEALYARYGARGLLREVPGQGDIEAIHRQVVRAAEQADEP